MKRAFLLFSCLLISSFSFLAFSYNVDADSGVVKTHAEAAALIDVTSGKILYSYQGDKQMRIASLTKIMTAIVAIEAGKLTDQVKVSKNAAGKEGSSIYLKQNEQMSLNNMLYGLMLRSGNDAATAIAEHVGGSLDGFIYLMNEKAQMLGMDHSHFMNPHGLDGKEHYSTARDMAVLSAYALRNAVFREIVKTKIKKVPNPNEAWSYVWPNKNKMLSLYPNSDGVKTGYTKLANRCLVSSATRGGQQLAVVTLNDSDDWADHSKLLDYGFKHFPLKQLVDKGERMPNGMLTSKSFSYPLTAEESQKLTKQVKLENDHSLSFRLKILGQLTFYIEGQEIGKVPLVAENSIQTGFIQHLHSFIYALFVI
ncbi:MAG: D-alanyl-D-alanine carboxypeptidase [Bacilli bacterium]|nr:D-alanyl-D-alanine carboxypeptidase [Bacilli bacterium]